MPTSQVSADPKLLDQFAEQCDNQDEALVHSANRLIRILEHFESRCTEPGIRVSASGLATELKNYSNSNLECNNQVRLVGDQFAKADGQSLWLAMGLGPLQYWEANRLMSVLKDYLRYKFPIFLIIMRSPAWLVNLITPTSWIKGKSAQPDLVDQAQQPSVNPAPANVLDFTTAAEDITGDDNRYLHTVRKPTPANNPNDAVGFYDRLNFGGTFKSNCTWYVAAAVSHFSKGRINLNSGKYGISGQFNSGLGSGGKWAANAKAALEYKDYISAVDRIPEAGSVICFPDGGHVAFVEDVQLVEKEITIEGKKTTKWMWNVTVSEENAIYTGKPTSVFKNSTEVKVDGYPDVKRWRRTIEFYTKIDNPHEIIGDAEFIHFNY